MTDIDHDVTLGGNYVSKLLYDSNYYGVMLRICPGCLKRLIYPVIYIVWESAGFLPLIISSLVKGSYFQGV